MNQNLSKEVKISKAITVTNGAAGTTSITAAAGTSTIFDMQGYEGILFIVQLGAIVANAVTSLKVQQGDASDLSDATDLTGSAQTIADTDDEKVLYVDIAKPQKRYISLYVARATQNATVSAIAVQYGARKSPPSHGTGVAGETWISPAAGTA